MPELIAVGFDRASIEIRRVHRIGLKWAGGTGRRGCGRREERTDDVARLVGKYAYQSFEFLDPIDFLLTTFRGCSSVASSFSIQLSLLLLVHRQPEFGKFSGEL